LGAVSAMIRAIGAASAYVTWERASRNAQVIGSLLLDSSF